MQSKILSHVQACLVFTLALPWIGCNGDSRPPTYPVTGKVTWKGQSVEKASVIFVPDGKGESASAETDAKGVYNLTTFVAGDGARPGNYRIKVMTIECLKYLL